MKVFRTGKVLRRDIVQAAKGMKGFFVIPIENPSYPGTPDIYICINGTSFWIEVKYGKEKKRPAQELWHEQIAHCAGQCFTLVELEPNVFQAGIQNKVYTFRVLNPIDLLETLLKIVFDKKIVLVV